MRSVRRGPALASLGLLLALGLVSGCSFHGVQDLPLPGGAAAGGHTYRVTAVFDDAMDLVPNSSVRVDDVPVGTVQRITLGRDLKAHVQMAVKDSVRLPANAVAVLRQTSLLGEKYVALEPPASAPSPKLLADGAVVPAVRTSDAASVEEVFSALSALLNGGGLPQLHTISVELNKALSGRESTVRDFLKQLDTFVGNLDAHKQEIVRALDAVDRLSAHLAAQTQTIDVALDDLAPGLKVLADQRPQLTAMLQGLSRLGDVATKVINASKADTVADLKSLQPILTKLDEAGTNLPNSLELLLDYPFPKDATNAMKGDYTGLRLTLDLDSSLSNLLKPPAGNPLCPPVCLPGGPGPGSGGPGSGSPLPLPSPPSLPTLPKLPSIPGLPGLTGQSGGQSSGQPSSPDSGLAQLLWGGLG